ncbi:MAG: Uma2 family endonuclease [Planctomycetes bacterium]|nr:Uma2 family endonuclease [Planctomycetota bacterium]
MATGTTTNVLPADEWLGPAVMPDYDKLVTEDEKPVDSLYAERQHLLLTTPLLDSWPRPGGRACFIASDVALYYSVNLPPFVPDVLLSLDVAPPQGDLSLKENRCYYVWKYGKVPDALVEVVANTIGGELTTKLTGYARAGVTNYIVWDPFQFLSDRQLHCFALERGKYALCDPWFLELELGVKVWKGIFGDMPSIFLRWCDRDGTLLPTGAERAAAEEQRANVEKQRADAEKQRADVEEQRAEAEKQRADVERQRAEMEKQRADALAARLRSLGIDPDKP